ncbi:MAG: hypothetical protein DWQ10_04455 [Calditrichaeota bacterium]|nr:MAG: hypothetical protein DWQ10_04455 [Calditrichota bacterium]
MKKVDLVQSAMQILNQCMHTENHNITIFCGEKSQKTGQLLYKAANILSRDVLLLQMDMAKFFSTEKPQPVVDLMNAAGLIVVTDKNVTQHKLRHAFKENPDVRILCINSPNEQSVNRWMKANHSRIALRTNKIADIFSIGHKLKMQTPAGTSLDMSIKPSMIIADAPAINGTPRVCLLPAGAVKIFPDAGSVNGKLAINFLTGTKQKDAPATLIVKNGLIHQIRGKNITAELLRRQLKRSKPNARKIVNFSIGTNDTASFGNSVFEDQKVLGGACVFIGEPEEKPSAQVNLTSAVMLSPSIYIDGRKILENGLLALN